MVTKKTWKEFKDSKLLWWVNRSLHLLGWAIVMVEDDKGVITDVYPARVKFRGFPSSVEDEGFIGLTKYLADESETLMEETLL